MSPSVAVCGDAAQALQTVPFCRECNSIVAICHWGDNQRGSQKLEKRWNGGRERKEGQCML